jgi:ABC-type transporter MlaC component
MQKIKLVFIVLLLSASANTQTTQEQKTVQQTVVNMFATLTNADTKSNTECVCSRL